MKNQFLKTQQQLGIFCWDIFNLFEFQLFVDGYVKIFLLSFSKLIKSLLSYKMYVCNARRKHFFLKVDNYKNKYMLQNRWIE